MAKDGTNRGGARVGSGAKKKPLADKIAEGNPGKRSNPPTGMKNSVASVTYEPISAVPGKSFIQPGMN